MKDQCIDNVIVCTGAIDFTHTIPADLSATDTSSTVSTCTMEVDSVDSSAICSITSTLEIFDDSTDSWVEYTGAGASVTNYPWIKDGTFVAANRIVTVDTVDSTTYAEPITYNLRWRAYDARADKSWYDEFDIKIQYTCLADTVALANSGAGMSNWIYTIGDTSGTTNHRAASTSTTHDETCPLTMACEQFDEASQSWIASVDPFIK